MEAHSPPSVSGVPKWNWCSKWRKNGPFYYHGPANWSTISDRPVLNYFRLFAFSFSARYFFQLVFLIDFFNIKEKQTTEELKKKKNLEDENGWTIRDIQSWNYYRHDFQLYLTYNWYRLQSAAIVDWKSSIKSGYSSLLADIPVRI